MDSNYQTLLSVFITGDHVLKRAVADLSREELLAQPLPGVNPILWMAGHLTATRCRLSGLLGTRVEMPGIKLFRRGEASSNPEQLPQLEEVMNVWNKVSEVLLGLFRSATEEQLSAPAPEGMPSTDKTMRGCIALLGFHEAYHLGQIGLLRKTMGKPPLVG